MSNMAVCREATLKEMSSILRQKRRIAALSGDDFFCHSDLKETWKAGPCKAIFYELSEDQRIELLKDLIFFLSFLLLVGTHADWYSECRHRLFASPSSISLVFTDEDGPRTEHQLRDLGLNDFQAESWRLQYLFRPAKITFDTELWTQRVDSLQPLPFEHPPNKLSSQFTSTFENSMTYEKDMVSVRVGNLPRSPPIQVNHFDSRTLRRPLAMQHFKGIHQQRLQGDMAAGAVNASTQNSQVWPLIVYRKARYSG